MFPKSCERRQTQCQTFVVNIRHHNQPVVEFSCNVGGGGTKCRGNEGVSRGGSSSAPTGGGGGGVVNGGWVDG